MMAVEMFQSNTSFPWSQTAVCKNIGAGFCQECHISILLVVIRFDNELIPF